VRSAFSAQFRSDEENGSDREMLWVQDFGPDYVLVESNSPDLKPGQLFQVPFEINADDSVTFPARRDWTVVEMTPRTPPAPQAEEDPAPAEESAEESDVPSEELGEDEGLIGGAPEAEVNESEDEIPPAAEPSAVLNSCSGEQAIAEAATDDRAGQGRKFRESFDDGLELLEATDEGQPRIVRGLLITADVVGINGRRYRDQVLQEAVAAGQRHLRESMSQGRAVLLGEAEHPSHKGGRPAFLETIVVWRKLDYTDKQVWIEGEMIENSRGRDAIATMDAGVLPGLSLRGRGMAKTIEENGLDVDEVQWVRFTGFDLVLNPSFLDSAITVLESEAQAASSTPMEETNMEPDKTASAVEVDLDAEKKNWAAELQESAEAEQAANAAREAAELAEAQTARLAELEEAAAKSEATEWLREAVAEVGYEGNILDRFTDMVGEPATLEEAQRSFGSSKDMVDAFLADMKLRSRGMTVTGNVDVVGEVIEQADEAGVPGFAAPAVAIAESVSRVRGAMVRPDVQNPRNINERLTQDYLARYDDTYKHKLLQEAREWAEAETTTQLNLPYSVTRAVIEEAFPELIAASIFDVGVVNASPLRIWYEMAFEAEAGATGTATDESITSSDDTWVALAGARIDFGTVVVTTDPAGTTYDEGDDYVIDYVEGRIRTLSGGAIADAAALLVDYTYKAYRQGEGLGIERARTTLSYVTVDVAADRLATQITSEAIAFSRAQLGLDIVTGNINALLKDMLRTVDGNLFANGLSEVLAVANNSGGTWTSATDATALLVKAIGVAKVKIANRYHTPQSVVMSLTNSDRLSNDDAFTAAGARSDASLDAAGYVGRVKGLNVFASTEFTDAYILVCDRQLVHHRVFQPVQMKGPLPVIDSNQKTVAAEEYYAEEFNVTTVPVPGKGATVKIA